MILKLLLKNFQIVEPSFFAGSLYFEQGSFFADHCNLCE